MLGDYAREASVLVLVFGMLDPLFHEPEIPGRLRSTFSSLANSEGKIHPVLWYVSVIVGSVVLLVAGIRFERRR